jgi:hypothetical protein
MMTRRALLGLSATAIASIGGALLLTPKTPAPVTGGLAFPDLARRLQGAARLELRKHDTGLVVVRQGGSWVLPDKADYPVRPEKLREVLTGLTELRLLEPRTSDPALFGRLGLDDPMQPGSSAVLLRVLDGAGAPLAELILGRRRVRTQGNLPESIFVRRPGETQTWLAEARLPVEPDAQLWLDRDIANLPAARIERVVVRRTGAAEIVLVRAEAAEPKLRIESPAEAPPADPVALDEIGRAFEFLTFVDVKPTSAATGEALGEARFGLTEGLTVIARPSREGETLWLRLAAEGGPEAAALNARWAPWAFQVGAWKEKATVPKLADLEARPAAPPK